ncbi:MAG TPA: hypothetical protein VL172_08460 [Kofleriaceae bacterium]|jgi:hypothetical protein|nr:hypothetical protein [Kofleriaceae bacterium]
MPPKTSTWNPRTPQLALACALLASACGKSGEIAPPGADGSVPGQPDAANPTGGDDGSVPGQPDASPPDANPPDAAPVFLSVCATGGADYSTLQAAVDDAPAGATLLVCAGTYGENLVIDGKQLTVRGTDGRDATIIEANRAGAGILVRNTGGTGVILEGLTVRNGYAPNGGALRCADSVLAVHDSALLGSEAGQLGGGMYASACTVELIGVLARGNTSSQGGGIYLDGGAATIRQTEIRQNHARTRGGGIVIAVDAVIEDSTISDNIADWVGGGLYAFEGAAVVRHNLIHGNTSKNDGGGLYFHMGTPQIIDNTIEFNTSGDDGGGLRIFTANALVQGNLVRNNTTGDGGGGIRVSHKPTQFIDNIIRDNEASVGGAIDMDNDSSQIHGGQMTGNHASSGGAVHMVLAPWNGGLIEDVLIQNNRAYRGAGIFLEQNYQPITLRRLRIIGNHGGKGGAIHFSGTNFVLSNSVLAGNDADHLGGAIYAAQDRPWTDVDTAAPPSSTVGVFQFLVIHGNQADDAGAVLYKESPHQMRIEDSILFDNTGPTTVTVVAPDPSDSDPAPSPVPPTWRYNDLMPGGSFEGMSDPTGSDGNIAANPMFVDAGDGNYHLTSGSPAIDAADPAITDPDSTRADMGRFGGPLGSP